jgi:hypothetical protein
MHQRWLIGPLVAVLLLLVVLSGCTGESGGGGQEQEEQTPDADLDTALEQSFEESGAPGVVAAVQTPEYTWVETRGMANLSSEEPITLDMHQRIGSVTNANRVDRVL